MGSVPSESIFHRFFGFKLYFSDPEFLLNLLIKNAEIRTKTTPPNNDLFTYITKIIKQNEFIVYYLVILKNGNLISHT